MENVDLSSSQGVSGDSDIEFDVMSSTESFDLPCIANDNTQNWPLAFDYMCGT